MPIATVINAASGYGSPEPPDERDVASPPPPYDEAWTQLPPRYGYDFAPSYRPHVHCTRPPQYEPPEVQLLAAHGAVLPGATSAAHHVSEPRPYFAASGLVLQLPLETTQHAAPAPPPVQQQPTTFVVPTHTVWSLLNTLLCFSPLAMAALYYSTKVRGSRSYDEAMTYSNRAKALNCLSTGLSLTTLALVVGVYLFRVNPPPPNVVATTLAATSTSVYGYYPSSYYLYNSYNYASYNYGYYYGYYYYSYFYYSG